MWKTNPRGFSAFQKDETHINRPQCPNYNTLNVDWYAAKK